MLSEISSDRSNSYQFKSFNLTGNGLPVNPLGRTGIAGRGNYARFGPNRLFVYIIVCCEIETNNLMVN